MPNPTNNEWEKEFDDRFEGYDLNHEGEMSAAASRTIKDFIRSTHTAAYEAGHHSGEKTGYGRASKEIKQELTRLQHLSHKDKTPVQLLTDIHRFIDSKTTRSRPNPKRRSTAHLQLKDGGV